MNIERDERVKHRIIGLAVLISIVVIFAPTIFKKSNQKMERRVTMNLELPEKPPFPQVVMNDENHVIKQAEKVSQPDIKSFIKKQQSAQQVEAKKIIIKPSSEPQVVEVATVRAPKASSNATKEGFSVQLATFSNPLYAETLKKKLLNQGYDPQIIEVKKNKTRLFKVFVGHSVTKTNAQALQKKLITEFQLHGLIVNQRVA